MFLLMATSCRKKEESVMPIMGTIQVDNTSFSLTSSASSNEDCNSIYVAVPFTQEFPYYIQLRVTKKGDLIDASIVNGQANYGLYTFHPLKYFTIKSFHYDERNQTLDISFGGNLFDGKKSKAIQVAGELNSLAVKPYQCKSVWPYLKAQFGTSDHNLAYSSMSGQVYDKISYKQFFYLNNGYRLVMTSAEPFMKLANSSIKIGADTSSKISVLFEKYVVADQDSISQTYRRNEWQEVKVNGTIAFGEVVSIENSQGIKGTLSLNAEEPGNSYQHLAGEFVILEMTGQ